MTTGLVCFIVDDDEDDREIFAIALQDADKSYKCLSAVNGKEALEKLKTDQTLIPDFIFLDLNMPFMSGMQFLVEIKQIPHLSHIPIIIYTTSSREKDLEETKQHGASYYLVKPSRIDTLTKILSGLLQKQHLNFSLNEEFNE